MAFNFDDEELLMDYEDDLPCSTDAITDMFCDDLLLEEDPVVEKPTPEDDKDLYSNLTAPTPAATKPVVVSIPVQKDGDYYLNVLLFMKKVNEKRAELRESFSEIDKINTTDSTLVNNSPVPCMRKDFDFSRAVDYIKFERTIFADPYKLGGFVSPYEPTDVKMDMTDEFFNNLLPKLAGRYIVCSDRFDFNRAVTLTLYFHARVTAEKLSLSHQPSSQAEATATGRGGRVLHHQQTIEWIKTKNIALEKRAREINAENDKLNQVFATAYKSGSSSQFCMQNLKNRRLHNRKRLAGHQVGVFVQKKRRGGRDVQRRRAAKRFQSLQQTMAKYGARSNEYMQELAMHSRHVAEANKRRSIQSGLTEQLRIY